VAFAQHEDIYLKGSADGEAYSGIAAWFAFYYTGRSHQVLGEGGDRSVARRQPGPFGDKAVDMMDNARALCPHAHSSNNIGKPFAVAG
jgi:hypothetical protein